MTPSRVAKLAAGGTDASPVEVKVDLSESSRPIVASNLNRRISRVWFAGNVSYVFRGLVNAPYSTLLAIPLSWDYVIYQLEGNLLPECFCATGSSGVRLKAKNKGA